MASVTLKFDALQFVQQGRIMFGTYKGSYLVAPSGRLNWYFANLGLLPFVPRISGEVAQYVDLYLAHLTADAKIQDVTFTDGDVTRPSLHPSDSDDSYTATFLSLVSAYVQATGDVGWFNARLPRLMLMAERNLIHNRYPNGLTYPFQSQAQYDLAYLQDNCEVYRGLADFVDCLGRTGHADLAASYKGALAATLRGVAGLYSSRTRSWWWDYVPNGTHEAVISGRFYPDLVSQVFPQAYSVPVFTDAQTAGFAYLNRYAPGWPEGQCPAMPDGMCDDFPWAILGYVAALRGQRELANRQINHVNDLSQTQRGALTINELGWYQRTLNLLMDKF